VASVRSCQKLPPCLIKTVPAGSKMDSSLAKAKPISNGGSASVITYLRRRRKNKTAVEREESECSHHLDCEGLSEVKEVILYRLVVYTFLNWCLAMMQG